mmetsp:Transcript_107565/g.304184  ORF Transcript_107565/g.304184 Transcript_107565/m.304184 type:complete len:476 (+) Transcript_107565:1934-3361(+)
MHPVHALAQPQDLLNQLEGRRGRVVAGVPEWGPPVVDLQRVRKIQDAPLVLLGAIEQHREPLHAQHAEQRVVVQELVTVQLVDEPGEVVVVQEVEHQPSSGELGLVRHPVCQITHGPLAGAGHKDVPEHEVQRVVVHGVVVAGGVRRNILRLSVDHLKEGRNGGSCLGYVVQEAPEDVPRRVHADAVEAVLVDVGPDPVHQALPHHGVLMVVVGKAVELAALQERGAALVVLVVHEAAVVRVKEGRVVEGPERGERRGAARVGVGPARVVQVDVHDDLHPSLVQEHDEVLDVLLGAILGVDAVEVLRPVPVVAVGHLLHDRRQYHPVNAQSLEVVQLRADAGDGSPAVVLELLAVRGRGSGEAVDEDLVHRHLRPRPGAPGQLVPLRRGSPEAAKAHVVAGEAREARLDKVGLVPAPRVGLVEEGAGAGNPGIPAVVLAPGARPRQAHRVAAGLLRVPDAGVRLHVEELPHQHRV